LPVEFVSSMKCTPPGTAPFTDCGTPDKILVRWTKGAAALEYDLCVKDTFVPSKIKGGTDAGDKQKCLHADNTVGLAKNKGVRLSNTVLTD